MRKITCEVAAKVMNKNATFVRQALAMGLLPFGMAMPDRPGRQRADYYINTKDFIDYTGVSEEELDRAIAEVRAYRDADLERRRRLRAEATARAGAGK